MARPWVLRVKPPDWPDKPWSTRQLDSLAKRTLTRRYATLAVDFLEQRVQFFFACLESLLNGGLT